MRVKSEKVHLTLEDIRKWEVPHPSSPQTDRNPGIHESEIVRNIALRGGVLKPQKIRVGRRGEEWVEEERGLDPVLLAVGLAWECWAAGLYPEMLWQPAEGECDQVYMNMDGLSYTEDGELVVEEFKFTRKSSEVNKEPRVVAGEWMWMAQVKNYCKAVGALRARLHVLYVNGNYRFSEEGGGPQYCRYELEFTQQEIDDNWAVMGRARERMAEEKKGVEVKDD